MSTPGPRGDSETTPVGRGAARSRPASADEGDELADTVILPSARQSARWRRRWPLLLALVWAVLAAINIVLFGIGPSGPEAGATRSTAGPRITAAAPGPSATTSASTSSATPSPSVQPTIATQVLTPVGISAYGPTGLGSGDNSSHAIDAIDASAATAWETDWYRSAAFGNLQAGTGLLIDMGRQVTLTSVRITLGSTPGADLELLTGNTPAQSQMLAQASVSDAGGTVSVNLVHPESARYLLIWLTLLPPDSTGTYQASVSDVVLVGTG